MQMPSLAFDKLSLGPPIQITSTTTQLVLDIIYFINPIKEAAKTNYYRAQFERNKGNLKTTWKLIGTIVNRKVSHSPPDIKMLVIEQKSYTDKESICDKINTYFFLIVTPTGKCKSDSIYCQIISK
jgi:hypothetical protein